MALMRGVDGMSGMGISGEGVELMQTLGWVVEEGEWGLPRQGLSLGVNRN